MLITLRKLGNSRGVIIPKPLLAQVGMSGEAEIGVENGAIVLRPTAVDSREGWADAARAIADAGDDAAVWPAFGNLDDEVLKW
jgi:antitoxin MazE